MTPEEFQRLKDEEKAHLRKMKELKEMARGLRRQQSVNRAINEITSLPEKLSDTYNEMMDRLGLAHATNEAKLDMALEAADERAAQEKLNELSEEDVQKMRAQQLVSQMRTETSQRAEAPPIQEPKKEEPSTGTASLPEKTIGRMQR